MLVEAAATLPMSAELILHAEQLATCPASSWESDAFPEAAPVAPGQLATECNVRPAPSCVQGQRVSV